MRIPGEPRCALPGRPAILFAVALASVAAPAYAAREQSSCATCHDDVAELEAGRPHAREGVSCVSCHGGDPAASSKEAAKAEDTGYRGVLEGLELVTVCGECHADVRRMNPYGLPTDQLAQYRTSGHGTRLFEGGDRSTATCASCHGAHGVLGPSSSESRVHPTRVPSTCGECHADEALMDSYGLDASIPEDYRESVHAQLLLERNDLSAPQCATCHGSHGAVPPGFRTVAAVCGKCHVRERELFDQSPHGPLVEEGMFPGCATCHSEHAVKKPELAIFDRLCGLCHSGEEGPLGVRDRIAGELRSARDLLASTRADVEEAALHGLVTEDDRLLLQEAETAVERTQVLLHALEVERVEESTAEAEEGLRELSRRLTEEREEVRLKRVSIIPVVVFLALMSFGFWLRYRRIHAQGHIHAKGGARR